MKKLKRLIFYLLTITVFLSAFASITVSAANVEIMTEFVYTDSNSGVKFTIPRNWKQEAFTEDNDYLTAKFVSTKEDDGVIIFSGTDIWAKLPYFGKKSSSRAEIDNSIFTKADVAEMCNTTEDNISLYMYNGIEYYKCTITANKEVHGASIDVTVTQLLYVNNGWMYIFGFWGDKTHKLYSDFEKLVRSVEYPTSQPLDFESSSTPDYTFDSDADTDDESFSFDFESFIPNFIISIIATVFLYGAFPIIFAKVRKAPIKSKKYRILCYCINAIPMVGFIILSEGVYNAAPYMIWTSVFSSYGIKQLGKRGILCNSENCQESNVQKTESVFECKICGHRDTVNFNFCPKCGARAYNQSGSNMTVLENKQNDDKK